MGRGGGPEVVCGIGDGGKIGWECVQPIALGPVGLILEKCIRYSTLSLIEYLLLIGTAFDVKLKLVFVRYFQEKDQRNGAEIKKRMHWDGENEAVGWLVHGLCKPEGCLFLLSAGKERFIKALASAQTDLKRQRSLAEDSHKVGSHLAFLHHENK